MPDDLHDGRIRSNPVSARQEQLLPRCQRFQSQPMHSCQRRRNIPIRRDCQQTNRAVAGASRLGHQIEHTGIQRSEIVDGQNGGTPVGRPPQRIGHAPAELGSGQAAHRRIGRDSSSDACRRLRSTDRTNVHETLIVRQSIEHQRENQLPSCSVSVCVEHHTMRADGVRPRCRPRNRRHLQ